MIGDVPQKLWYRFTFLTNHGALEAVVSSEISVDDAQGKACAKVLSLKSNAIYQSHSYVVLDSSIYNA
jgi:hypothetical protein